MSAEGTESTFARMLEACATGLGVQESMLAVCPDGSPAFATHLADASTAACEVAAEMLEQGLDPDDLDPSWMRLRRYVLGLKENA